FAWAVGISLAVLAFGTILCCWYWYASVQHESAIAAELERRGASVSRLPLPRFSRFYEVSMGGRPVRDDDLELLRRLPGLRVLAIMNSTVSETGMSYVGECGEIESLFLGNTNVTDAGLQSLSPLRRLTGISLVKTQITDESPKTLGAMTGLQVLSLNHT